MASIRKAKKLGIYKAPKYTKERAKMISETRKLVDETNRRLKGLENAGYKGSWASKKLISRLNSKKLKSYKKGKVVVDKTLTNTQLVGVQKALRQFLDSKTSKAKGIRDTRDATIKSLQATLSKDKQSLVTEEDAEFYYDMLGESDFEYFADKIGASTMWSLIEDAIEEGDTESSWLNRLGRYITLNDLDVRDRAIRLYDKYIF